jgi:hypothetical protein
MKLKVFASIAFPATLLAASLAGCAMGPGPGLTGNDSGGIIPWSPENRAISLDWAEQHCARYGKHARITSVYPEYGAYIGFACTFGPGYTVRERQVILRTRG